LTSVFSCVLLALLAVGRIMRAKKPSSIPPRFAALVEDPTLLARDVGRLLAAVPPTGREGRDADLRTVEVVEPEGVRDRSDTVEALRLRLCCLPCSSPSFADDAAVGAVRWVGSLTGLVGDFGAGFTKPPVLTVPFLG
jgi:hypothetical protein